MSFWLRNSSLIGIGCFLFYPKKDWKCSESARDSQYKNTGYLQRNVK